MEYRLLPDGFRARPATLEDAVGVSAVITALEGAHNRGTETQPDALLADWATVNLKEETIVVEAADGTIAAYADVMNRANVNFLVYAYVHPAFTGRGLGRFLMEWGETWALDHSDEAPPDAQIDVRQFVPQADLDGQTLLQEHGYEPVRSTWVMRILLDDEPPEAEWPEGIEPRPFRPGQDEREVYEAVEEASKDLWGRPRSTYERFLKFTQHQKNAADLWILAQNAEGNIVGTSLGEIVEGAGWIGNVGVLRQYRRRGIGHALLKATFAAFHRLGVRDVRLRVDVDSPTSAPRLYERAGMHPLSTFILHQKILRTGIDLGDRTAESN
jgi:mycothiol synthase